MFKTLKEKILNKQECYGHYCNKCKQQKLMPTGYDKFTMEFWNEFRKIK